MIVNEEEALERLLSPDNLINKLEVRAIEHNNKHHNNGEMINTLIAITSAEEGTVEAGRQFGMTHKSAEYHRDRNQKAVQTVHDNALDAMLESINLLKPKLKSVKKATDLSKVAADLARVVEKTSPKEGTNVNLKVVVMAPPMRAEESYEEITVS